MSNTAERTRAPRAAHPVACVIRDDSAAVAGWGCRVKTRA